MHNVHIHMYFRGIVLVLESGRHECIGADNPVHEVGTALYHALVYQLAEWLVLAYIPEVVEELVPEAGVNEMAGGVFRSADIQVYAAPVFISLARHKGLVVVGVHIAEIVCA